MVESELPNKWRERVIRYAPLLLWIGVVLFASTAQGSMQNTSHLIRPILVFLFPNSSDETINAYHAIVRKLAHLTEYAILAFWACRAFWSSAVEFLRRFWFVFALILVFLIASVDEYNQSFDILRTGSVYDVLLDVAGGTLMIVFLAIYKRMSEKISFDFTFGKSSR